ncbi:unnamed protein product [Effrenium voratum]|nr:unnamed protein product [Effrenium voratum]
MAAAKAGQVGRLPASRNIKTGKGNLVVLLHSCLQDMNERVYLKLVPDPKLFVQKGVCQVARGVAKQKGAAGPDCSAQDWRTACSFFEANPSATVNQALKTLRGSWLAQRPNQAYYEQLTATNACKHVKERLTVQQASSSAQASASAGPGGSASLPAASSTDQAVSAVDKARNLFAHKQWLKKTPTCYGEVERGSFSDSQWLAGSGSRCKLCVRAASLKQSKRAKVCKDCNVEKAKDDFSTTQWQLPLATGSCCVACCQKRLATSQTAFTDFRKNQLNSKAKPQPMAQAADVIWPAADKAGARWLLEAPLLALPSENLQSYQAMHGLRGTADWTQKSLRADESGIPAKQKIALLTAAHEELSHMGGRDAIVKALAAEGKECRTNTMRDLRRAEPRHLPTPGHAGEVIGFDLKTVKPHNANKWLMLLAVDFCSKKCWAWDLDYGQGDLPTVQGVMLRFFAEHELPLVVWTDNGGSFRNVIQVALQQAIGARPRHIPPGRPQANGLVEVYNRILDSAHAGERARLLSAVVAYNHMPQARLKHWRVLRPAESRRRNLQLQALVHGPARGMTDAEWLGYLDQADKLDTDFFVKAADGFHEKLEPVREAMASKHLRQAMQKNLRYDSKRKQACEAPVLSGDRVIVKNSQYTSKTGHGKFETKDGKVREHTVQSVSQGFVELTEVGSGASVYKHEASLKLMPHKLPADDGHVPSPPPKVVQEAGFKECGPFYKIAALADGACLYRCFHMATQYLAGIAPQALARKQFAKKETVWKLASEMADDPLWAGSAAGDWDWGLTVEIYQEEADGLELIWRWWSYEGGAGALAA